MWKREGKKNGDIILNSDYYGGGEYYFDCGRVIILFIKKISVKNCFCYVICCKIILGVIIYI